MLYTVNDAYYSVESKDGLVPVEQQGGKTVQATGEVVHTRESCPVGIPWYL